MNNEKNQKQNREDDSKKLERETRQAEMEPIANELLAEIAGGFAAMHCCL